jgi:DNA primase
LPFFSEQTIDRVRSAADILEIAGQYTDLRRVGPDSYVGLCPFHAEKTPSFSVSPEKGFFYCFGCQAGGDAIRFLQLKHSMSFPEAVRELARTSGVDLPEDEGQPDGASLTRERRQQLYGVMERASELFSDQLWGGGVGVRNYLRARGVGDAVIRSFRLGYSPPGWQWLSRELLKEGWQEDLIVEAGLAKPRSLGGVNDVFHGRLTVPILERDGRTAAFAGRLMDAHAPSGGKGPEDRGAGQGGQAFEAPKYINSPTTPIYTKGRLLYGMPQAEPFLEAAGCVFIVEGYFDLIALHAAGIRYSAAAMGTALTQTQVNMLRNRDLEVFLLFDGDAAGRDAAVKALPKLLNAGLNGRAVILPADHDPDTFLRKNGPDSLMRLAEKSPTATEYACMRLLAVHDDSIAGRSKAAEEARAYLSEVIEPFNADLLRGLLASGLGVRPESLLAKPKSFAPGAGEAHPGPAGGGQGGSPGRAGFGHAWDDTEGMGELEHRSARLLDIALSTPPAVPLLERLRGRWPQEQAGALADELLAQYRESGTVLFPKLSSRFREGPLGELVSRAATRPLHGDPSTALSEAEQYLNDLLAVSAMRRLDELKEHFKQALADGDGERLDAVRAEQKAIRAELNDRGRNAAS